MLTQIEDSQSPASVTLLLHIWEDVAMDAAIALRSDFDSDVEALGTEDAERKPSPKAAGAGGDLRW